MTLGPIDNNRPPVVDSTQNEAEKAEETETAKPSVTPQTATGTRLKSKGFGRFKISQSDTNQGPSVSAPPSTKEDSNDSAAGA